MDAEKATRRIENILGHCVGISPNPTSAASDAAARANAEDAARQAKVRELSESLKFDPTSGHVIRKPLGTGYGFWVGGHKVTYDAASGFFIIFYRVRTPLEKGRGGTCAVAVSRDGLNFTDVWSATKDDLAAVSIETGHVVRDPKTGLFRLYISYEFSQGNYWRIDVIRALNQTGPYGGLGSLDTQGRRTVLMPHQYGLLSIKDPVVYVRPGDGRYMLYAHAFPGSALFAGAGMGQKARAFDVTVLAESDDGLYFSECKTCFESPNEDRWDGRLARINSVVPWAGVGYLGFYDGQRTVFDIYEEKAGLCWSADGGVDEPFERLPLDGPWVSSPHGSRTVRYIFAVKREDQGKVYMYYEFCRPDNSHDLRVSVVPIPK